MHKGSEDAPAPPLLHAVQRQSRTGHPVYPLEAISAPVNQLFTDWICGNAGFVWAESPVKAFGVVPYVLVLAGITSVL